MTENTLSIQIEEMVLTIQTLIEQQQEQLADSKNQNESNEQFTQKIIETIEPLTSLLNTYQAKEHFITEKTGEILKQNIGEMFKLNQSAYHAMMIKGFNRHIDTSTKHLSTVAVETTQLVKDLKIAADNSKTEFESRRDFFKLYEDTYDKQARELKESVNSTLTDVIQNTKDKLDDIGSDFSNGLIQSLSLRVAGVLGTICISIMVLMLGAIWLFVPSKAEITERQDQYDQLVKAQIVPSITKRSDGYYARVGSEDCIKNINSSLFNETMLCKIE